MKELAQAAADLQAYQKEHPEESDQHLMIELVYDLELHKTLQSHDCYDDIWVQDGNERLFYLFMPGSAGDMPGEPTICILKGEVRLIDPAEWKAELDQKHARENGLVICKACGAFQPARTCPADCDDCGNLTDAETPLDSETLAQQFKDALKGCTELEDGDYEHLWVVQEKLPTHKTPSRHTWLFVKVIYMDQHERDPDPRYYGEIIAVNPSMAGKKSWIECCKSMDQDPDKKIEPVWKARLLMDYGIKATLVEESGNSKVDVLRRLNSQLTGVLMMGGSYLDRTQNALGSTGWDFLEGDVLAGLKR